MEPLSFALSGLVVGAVAALAGVGLLVTYQATGVFNIAHGAIGAMAGYLFWQLVVNDHFNTALGAVLVILIGAPLFGVLIERVVFRPLQRREASPAESLVATIGILSLLTGIITVVWHGQTYQAALLFPQSPIHLGSLIVQSPALIDLGIVFVVAIVIAVVTRTTLLGTRIRAVVDRRDLAELSTIDSGRVSAIAWATGSTLAALTGILLAPVSGLTPFGLTLLLLEIFAVPVIAGFTSFPIAIGAGLLIGVASAEMNLGAPTGALTSSLYNQLQSDLPVVVLLLALLIRQQLVTGSRGDAGNAAGLASRRAGEPGELRQAFMYAVAAVALFSPLTFSADHLRIAEQIPAYAIVFVSIVAVTGFSGQISLGQGGYAGLGALMFAKISADVPQSIAIVLAVLAAAIVGFLTGYPAIRRRGLFLALTTFAVGAFLYEFVFNQPQITSNITVQRPSIFGLSLNGDRAFYIFELCALGLAFYIMSTLQRGRLGRALIAIRDSETGARSVGVDVRHLKIFIFTVSAGLAGLGGALLAEQSRSFTASAFNPLESSLFWFTVVVVFGADSPGWAVVGAAFTVLFDAAVQPDAYIIPVGLFAALLGYFPGGIAELGRRLQEWLLNPTALMRRFAETVPPARAPAQLSARGRAIVAARVAARRTEETVPR